MTPCIPQLSLGFHSQLHVDLEFNAPHTSSDGGGLLLRQVDERLGLSRALATLLPDSREQHKVKHSRHEQLMQRIYQIALGYQDTNDADSLKDDPLLKAACDRLPADRVGLSSQPSLCRFENAASMQEACQILRYLEHSYVESLPVETSVIVLDIDSSADETHGGQQLSFFNAHYDHYIYHPLMIFDGVTGQLVTALLRPGNVSASRGAVALLRRIIIALKERLPHVQVVVRGDCGFCSPRLLEELEWLDAWYGEVDYLIGIAKNPVLLRLAENTIVEAEHLHRERGQTVRRFASFEYKAGSWSYSRHVLVKAEHNMLGRNPRFLVTSLSMFDPQFLYRAYTERGNCELFIKNFKNALFADRLSCKTFKANFFRLLLHAAAYRLMFALKEQLALFSAELGRAQFDTIRLRLLKVAALVTQSARRIRIQLPKTFPFAPVFRALAGWLEPGG